MNRIYVNLILCVFFPVLVCKAEMPILQETPHSYVPPGLFKDRDWKSDIKKLDLVLAPERPVRWTIRQVEIGDWDSGGDGPIRLSINNLLFHRACDDFLANLSSRYMTNKKFLSLSKTPFERDKEELSFVFFMNRDRAASYGTTDPAPEGQRAQVHIMWTGSKWLKVDQELIRDKYPLDVSLANYEDGYAPGEWNVVLPSRKPCGVKVAWAWAF